MLKKTMTTILLAASFSMFGCQSIQPSVKQQQILDQLQNKKWILTHIGAVEFKTDPTAHNVPSIQFDATTHRVSGADGCNLIMGTYAIQKDKITLSELAGSQMMCMNTMQLADQYNQALAKVAAYQVYNKTLRLLDSYGNPVLQFETTVQQR